MTFIAKKSLPVIIILILMAVFSFAQPQRMLLLPESMSGGADLLSICIDFFRETPKTENIYNYVIDGANVTGSSYSLRGTNTTKSMDIHAGSYNSSDEARIFGTKAEPISQQYQTFLEEKIEQYSGYLTESSHDLLQTEVWAYDVLNTFGYIPQSPRPSQAYANAVARFSKDFELIGSFEERVFSIVEIGEYIKTLKMLSSTCKGPNRLVFIYRNSNDGKYFVFDGAKKPIYAGFDEMEIARVLNSNCSEKYTIYTSLENFPSEDAKEAFVFTLNTQFKNKYSKGLKAVDVNWENFAVASRPSHYRFAGETNVLFEDNIYHKTFEFDNESFEYTRLFAAASRPSILTKFTLRVRSAFGGSGRTDSMITFVTQFRKELMENLELNTDDLFYTELITDFGEMRISKKQGSNDLKIALKW